MEDEEIGFLRRNLIRKRMSREKLVANLETRRPTNPRETFARRHLGKAVCCIVSIGRDKYHCIKKKEKWVRKSHEAQRWSKKPRD